MLLLTFIRALESFEIPLLIGTPANLQTFTTAIYQTIHRGFLPRYGEASAYSVLLVLVVALPLAGYYRITRHAQRYATITGKGFRPARIDLGALRLPAGLYLLIMPLAFVAPLLILLWASFLPLYEPPSVADFARLSLDNYYAVLTRPTTVAGLWNGVIVAVASSTAVTAFTFMLAWLVVRRREPARWLLDMLASLPLVLPGIVLGTAVLIEFLQADHSDLRHDLDHGVCLPDPLHALRHPLLLRRNRVGPRASRRMRAHLRGRHLHDASAHRVAADACRRLPRSGSMSSSTRSAICRLPIMLAGPQNRLIAVVILDLWNEGKVPEVGALSVLLALTATLLGWTFMRLSRRYGTKLF